MVIIEAKRERLSSPDAAEAWPAATCAARMPGNAGRSSWNIATVTISCASATKVSSASPSI
jgi:hypothetical protein